MWKTICSAPSKEELEQVINSYYFSSDYRIGDKIRENHFEVINMQTFRKAKNIVRIYRKRWQFGDYV